MKDIETNVLVLKMYYKVNSSGFHDFLSPVPMLPIQTRSGYPKFLENLSVTESRIISPLHRTGTTNYAAEIWPEFGNLPAFTYNFWKICITSN